MSKLLLVAVTASVLLTTPQASPLEATTSAVNFKPRDDPFVLYEDLKDALKKVNPELVTRVNEEEKQFKHDRDSFSDETKHFVDKVTVMYLEVTINTLNGQPPSPSDVYKNSGEIRFMMKDLSQEANKELMGSTTFQGLLWGH